MYSIGAVSARSDNGVEFKDAGSRHICAIEKRTVACSDRHQPGATKRCLWKTSIFQFNLEEICVIKASSSESEIY